MNRLIIFLFSILIFFSCRSKQQKIFPAVEKITESVYATGIVKARNQYQVFSTVNGLIKEIFITEGDVVHKGSPLMKLSNASAQLNNENAVISADYASLSSNTEKINELNVAVEIAKSKMVNDQSLLEKQKNLWQQGIGTKNDLDQRELSFTNSTKNYETAKLRLIELKKQLSLQEKQSRKNVEITKNIVSDFTIKSEVDGKVYNILKEKGEMVNAINPVAIIGDAASFYLELQIDEYDINAVKPGQIVFLTMDSYKGKVYEAVVTKINPIMNAQSKSFMVEAEFKIAPPTLYPNLTAEANIVIITKEKALTIPRSYITQDGFVMNSKKEKIKVVTGLKDYKKIEIISGISANDELIKPIP